jgi:glycosyltransferase involved in cell wall biosynthesis
VVYNGIDFSKFDKKYPKPEFLSGVGCKVYGVKERLKLCMVGNFVHTRVQKVIVEALRIIDDRLKMIDKPHIDFYFVGRRDEKEGWRYDECVKYCEEHGIMNVHFVGGRGDVPAILQHMDAFVYATAHDTFGIAVVEALANGLPTIVNDWGVMREVTCNGGWAMLYKTGDAEDCAEAIWDMIVHIEEEKEKAKKVSSVVRNTYSIEAHIKRLAEVYSKV